MTSITANDTVITLMKGGLVKEAFAFVEPKDPPPEVANLKADDNLMAPQWHRSGEDYVRWMFRLRQAAYDNRPLYRIVNRRQGTFLLPQFDELLDVTYAPVEGDLSGYCGAKAFAVHRALIGLEQPKDGRSEAEFTAMIADVFPHVYLHGRRRRIGPWHTVMGWFSASVRQENQGILLFRKYLKKLEQVDKAAEFPLVFSYRGWLLLLRDMAAGRVLASCDGDSDFVKEVLASLNASGPAMAQKLLAHAKAVMDETELYHNWPKDAG